MPLRVSGKRRRKYYAYSSTGVARSVAVAVSENVPRHVIDAFKIARRMRQAQSLSLGVAVRGQSIDLGVVDVSSACLT